MLHAKAASHGFTLVEVIVALVITALLLSIVMAGALEAKARGRVNQERREAVLLARSLAATAVAAKFEPGIKDGEAGNLKWRTEESALARDPRGFFVLSRIRLNVSNDKATLFTAETRKLKRLTQ